LNLAAAAEVPLGTGGILCSQWLLTQRFDQEPEAGLLLQRLLNYCAPGYPHAALKPIALVGETNAAAATTLTELSVLAENVSGRLAAFSPALYPVLMIAGDSNAWQEASAHITVLAAYANAGGKLVLHKPGAAFLSAAQPALFPELNYTDAQLGAVLRRDVTNSAGRLEPRRDAFHQHCRPLLPQAVQPGHLQHDPGREHAYPHQRRRQRRRLALVGQRLRRPKHQRRAGGDLPLQRICQRHPRAGRLADHDAQD
jgi:hypothetical protein